MGKIWVCPALFALVTAACTRPGPLPGPAPTAPVVPAPRAAPVPAMARDDSSGAPPAVIVEEPPAPFGGPFVVLTTRRRRGPDQAPPWGFDLTGLPALSDDAKVIRVAHTEETLGDVPNLVLRDVPVPGADVASETSVLTQEESLSVGTGDAKALRAAVERRVMEANARFARERFTPMPRCEERDPPESGMRCDDKVQRFTCGESSVELRGRAVRVQAKSGRALALTMTAKGPRATDGAARRECVRTAAFDAARGVLALERVSVCAAGGDACDDVTLWNALRLPPAK